MEHKEPKNNQSKQQEKRIQKNEDSISSLWDNFKTSNIHIMGLPEGKEKEQETGNVFEKIMKGNFPNLVNEIDLQFQEAQRVPIKLDLRKHTPRYIIITLPKINNKKNLQSSKRKVSYLQESSQKTVR